MRSRVLSLTLVLIAATLVAACGSIFGLPTIYKDANGLRTFPLPDGTLTCSQIAAIDPVSGTLRGQRGASDQAWLEMADGSHVSVVWPQGFSVRFDPVYELVDEQGRVVARGGDQVALPQIPTSAAAGSYDDPYFASGSLFFGCYPRRISGAGRAA